MTVGCDPDNDGTSWSNESGCVWWTKPSRSPDLARETLCIPVPNDIKQSPSRASFRQKLKTHLFKFSLGLGLLFCIFTVFYHFYLLHFFRFSFMAPLSPSKGRLFKFRDDDDDDDESKIILSTNTHIHTGPTALPAPINLFSC